MSILIQVYELCIFQKEMREEFMLSILQKRFMKQCVH